MQNFFLFTVIQYVKDHKHIKKAGTSRLKHPQTICKNKSGTAILLFHLQRLWYCLSSQTATLSPRRMYIIY